MLTLEAQDWTFTANNQSPIWPGKKREHFFLGSDSFLNVLRCALTLEHYRSVVVEDFLKLSREGGPLVLGC